MAVIFLSHSSFDDEKASAIKQRLAEAGFGAVFLDIDAGGGLRPGVHWRDELARRLRTSDAIVFLGSSSSEKSIWCAAELAVAKTLEKLVLPVQLEQTARHELLNDEQWVVFGGDLDETIVRLVRALEASPHKPDAHRWAWDESRSPFPGLRSFDIDDAGVFFGRDALIEELVAIVDPITALDHTSLIMVVGASGTGKSSLVRAGLAPALIDRVRLGSRWLCVPACVPALDCRRELARSLQVAGLDDAMLRAFIVGSASLKDAASTLVAQRGNVDKVLIVLDQAEELVSQENRRVLLSELADAALDGAGCRVVMTVREGYVGRLLEGLELDGRVRSVPITPMSRSSLAAAVEGPARRGDLELEDGFVQAVIDDVGTGDALPLLALALERTHRSALADGARVLRLERYQAGGGVAGAVAAQAAEAVARIAGDGERRAVELLVQLASIDDEGNWVRRTVSRSALEAEEWEVVRELERTRLVVVGGDDSDPTVSVAHSAVFSSWAPLARELNAAADDLQFSRRLERDAADWDKEDRPRDQLPRGTRYQQIVRFRRQRPDLTLGSVAEEYVAASRRLEGGTRRRRLSIIGVVVILAVITAALGVGQLQAAARAGAAERVADARRAIAQAVNEPHLDRAAELSLTALERDPTRDAAEALLGIVVREPGFRSYAADVSPDAARTVAWTSDHRLLAADSQGAIYLIDPGRPTSPIVAPDGTSVRAIAADPGGAWFAAGDRSGRVRVWTDASSEALELRRESDEPAHRGVVADIVPAGPQRLVTAGYDGDVVLWDVGTGRPVWVARMDIEVRSIAMHPADESLIVGTRDGQVMKAALDTGDIEIIAQFENRRIEAVAALGDDVLVGQRSGVVWLIDYNPLTAAWDDPTTIYEGTQELWSMTAIDSDEALTAWSDGVVRRIDRAEGLVAESTGHDEPIHDVSYDADTGLFAAASNDGLVSWWDLDGTSNLVGEPLETDRDLVGAIDEVGRLFLDGASGPLIEVADGEIVALSDDFTDPVLDLDVNDEGTIVALGFDDRAIAVDLASGEELASVAGLSTGGNGSASWVAVDDRRLIVAADDLVVIDLDTERRQEYAVPDDITVKALHVDAVSNSIIVGGSVADVGAVLLVWRDGSAEPVRRDFGQPEDNVQALDVDDDGRWLVVGRNGGRLDVWDFETMTLTDVAFSRHDEPINDVEFAPSSSIVVSLDGDGLVWIWNAESGTSYAQPIDTGLRYGRRIMISNDGTRLMVTGRGGVVTVRVDVASITMHGCDLARIDPCPFAATELDTVLSEG